MTKVVIHTTITMDIQDTPEQIKAFGWKDAEDLALSLASDILEIGADVVERSDHEVEIDYLITDSRGKVWEQ